MENAEVPTLPPKQGGLSGHVPGSYREILGLSWPMIISTISFTTMSFVSVMFVSWLGPSHTAAVVLGNTIAFQMASLAMGFLAAVRTVISQDFGARRHQDIGRDVASGLALAGSLGVVFLLVSLQAKPLAAWVAGTPTQAEMGGAYLFWRLLGFPAISVRIVFDNYFGAIGDTRTSMVVNILANLLNILLTYLLVFGVGPLPALGVEGAAMATVLSEISAACMGTGAFLLRSNSRAIRAQGRVLPNLRAMRRIMKVGMPLAVQFFLEIGSFNVINLIISHVGDAAMAANGIVVQLLMLSFLPAQGVANGVSILVGQYKGAGQPDFANLAARRGFRLTAIYTTLWTLVFIFSSSPFIRLFTRDALVLTYGVHLMYIIASFQVIDGLGTVAYGALQGAGDTLWPMLFGITGGWLVMVPVGLFTVFVLDWGVYGAWTAKACHIWVFALLNLWRFNHGAWRRITV